MFHFKKKILSFAKITKVDRFIKTTQNSSTNVASHKLLDHTTAGKKGRSTPAGGGRIARFPACCMRRLKGYPDGSASTTRVYTGLLFHVFRDAGPQRCHHSSNLSCPIHTEPLLQIVEHVADRAVRFLVPSRPLLHSNSSNFTQSLFSITF